MKIIKKPISEAPADGSELLIWEKDSTFPVAVKQIDYSKDIAEEVGERGYWGHLKMFSRNCAYHSPPYFLYLFVILLIQIDK